MVVHLTVEQRQLALRLRARGLSLRQDLERFIFLLGGSDGEPLFGLPPP